MSEQIRNVTIVTGHEGLNSLRQDWQSLSGMQLNAPFYTAYEWYDAYLRCLETSPEQVMFVVLRQDNRCTGILPLIRRSIASSPIALDVLESPKLTGMDLVGLPFDSDGSLADWWPLVRQALKQKGIRRFVLRLSGFLLNPLSERPLQQMSPWQIVRIQGHSSWFDCRRDYDDLRAAYTSRLVKILRKAQRGLEKKGEISIQTVTNPQDLEPAYNEFLGLEASGWKGDKGSSTALKMDQKRRYFLEAALFQTQGQICAEINVLRVGTQAVAAQLCVRSGGRLSLLKIAFDQALARFSPGTVLLGKLLARSCDDEHTEMVSLVTGQPWMDNWKPAHSPVADLWLFDKHSSAMLTRTALRVRDGLKSAKIRWQSS